MEDQVLAEYASPFKRRKAAPMDKARDAACFQSPPPAVRKFGRFFTPQAHYKAAGPAAPSTPGADVRAATDSRGRETFCLDGPAHEESLLSPEADPLPANLAILRDLLGALYATLPLVKARGQLTTFTNLRGPIQNLSSRAVKVAHLQQIKAIYPAAFTWQHIMVAAGRSGRQEEQLLIGLTPVERLGQIEAERGQQQLPSSFTPTKPGTRTPSKAGYGGVTPVKQASSGRVSAVGTPTSRGAAFGCSASVSGTMQQQKEFLKLLQALLGKDNATASDDLPLAPLPGPAPPSIRDSTPVRRQSSDGGGADSVLPRTPQTGASGRALMSPLATPPRAGVATPGTDGTVRSLMFSPVSTHKKPVPRFDLDAPAQIATPGRPPAAALATPGTKRNAAGTPLSRPSPLAAVPAAAADDAGAGLLSPRGRTRAGATGAMRPSRLCFDSVGPLAAAKGGGAAAAEGKEGSGAGKEVAGSEVAAEAEAAAARAPKVRNGHLTFVEAEKGPSVQKAEGCRGVPGAAAHAADGSSAAAQEAAGSGDTGFDGSKQGADGEGEAGGAGGRVRRLSSGLQFELKASTMALLDRAASAQVRVEQARVAAELSARHHLDLALSTFEILRCAFGNKGPCALPREQVVIQIRTRSTCKSGLSPSDAEEQLRLMLRLLPSWIRADHPTGGVGLAELPRKVMVRIHRRTPWGELRQQLADRVEEARRAGAVPQAGMDAEAAAAAEAADLAAAALDAAVLRARHAAEAQAGPEAEAEAEGGAGVEGAEGRGSGVEGELSEGREGSVEESGKEDEGGVLAGAGAGGSNGDQKLQGLMAKGAKGSKVDQEALAACLKARVWGRKPS